MTLVQSKLEPVHCIKEGCVAIICCRRDNTLIHRGPKKGNDAMMLSGVMLVYCPDCDTSNVFENGRRVDRAEKIRVD